MKATSQFYVQPNWWYVRSNSSMVWHNVRPLLKSYNCLCMTCIYYSVRSIALYILEVQSLSEGCMAVLELRAGTMNCQQLLELLGILRSSMQMKFVPFKNSRGGIWRVCTCSSCNKHWIMTLKLWQCLLSKLHFWTVLLSYKSGSNNLADIGIVE